MKPVPPLAPNQSPHLTQLRDAFRTDFLSSIVVFLVALPLCLGIAIASGAPPALGLITGIVGGLVVGTISGSPLQVSGPAAGLAVIVWDLIQRFGLGGLGVIVLLAGLIQIAAGVLRGGRWFQAVPPSLIYGMLAGIGVLILASQFHVMMDDKPRGSGVANLVSIPEAIWRAVYPSGSAPHHLAALTGVVTIGSLLAWNRFAVGRLRTIPGPLVAVIVATLFAAVFSLPIKYVTLPDNLFGAANLLDLPSLGLLLDPAVLVAAAALAIIASAETLLCAVAVDRMHDGPRTQFDRELVAQGVGNTLCGLLGALPMTGVIVRSSANVGAGAKTRLSAILHGAWLLAFVVAMPFVLRIVPIASLAAVLVFTGYKLVNVAVIKQLRRYGRGELIIYFGTLGAIVTTDLLTGVALGLGLALLRLVLTFSRLKLRLQDDPANGTVAIELHGNATFLRLPQLMETLASVPPDRRVRLCAKRLSYIDHACVQAIEDWERLYRERGGEVEIPWEVLHAHAQRQQESTNRDAMQPVARVAE